MQVSLSCWPSVPVRLNETGSMRTCGIMHGLAEEPMQWHTVSLSALKLAILITLKPIFSLSRVMSVIDWSWLSKPLLSCFLLMNFRQKILLVFWLWLWPNELYSISTAPQLPSFSNEISSFCSSLMTSLSLTSAADFINDLLIFELSH